LGVPYASIRMLAGLHIAVQHAGGVRGRQRIGDADPDAAHDLRR
jgi:hypothetical protein